MAMAARGNPLFPVRADEPRAYFQKDGALESARMKRAALSGLRG